MDPFEEARNEFRLTTESCVKLLLRGAGLEHLPVRAFDKDGNFSLEVSGSTAELVRAAKALTYYSSVLILNVIPSPPKEAVGHL